MNKIKNSFYVLGIIVLNFALNSCGSDQNLPNETEQEINSNKIKIQSVEVVKPIKRSFVVEILISGTAKPNQSVVVYALESGYVESIYKDIGDNVKKGDVIAELKNPELTRRFEQKNAYLGSKKSNYERLKSIYDKTPALTPIKMVEDAEAEYLSLIAELNAIQDKLNFLVITAPFNGKITKRLVDNGALVQSGLTQTNPQGIVELQQINPIRLTVPLPESDVASIAIGDSVKVTFPELPLEQFNVTVSRTAGSLDPASKTMQVEMDINNSNEFIKPGMYAKALLQISGKAVDVLSLPLTTQIIKKKKVFISVVNDGKVEQLVLRKGLSNKDYFEVLNSEINENSLIINMGKGLVQAGQSVNPVLNKELK